MVYPALHAHISLAPLKLTLAQLQNQPNSTSPDEVLNFITEIFETLTSTENVSFRRLFDRMVYASERLNISPASLKPLHRFRIQHKQFTKGAPFPHALIAHTLAALTTLFAQLDGLPTGDVAAVQSEQRTPGTSFQNLKVVLVSKGKLEHDNRGVAWFTFQAVQEDQDPDCSSCQVIIRDIRPNSGNSIDFAYLHPLLRPFVTLRLLQFRATTKGDQIILENSYDSQVVLEPDFLVDASELAQCIKFKSADDPNSYFLRKLIPREAGGAAFQGNVINFVLDEIVAQPEEFDYTKSFKHAIKQQSLKAVNLGREAIAEMYRHIKQYHLPNLQGFAQSIRHLQTTTEPTFFSDKYGLSGRLDFLITHAPHHADVVELKSGRVGQYNGMLQPYPSQEYQVLCYYLLLESAAEAAGNTRQGVCQLLFSRFSSQPLAVSPTKGEQLRRLLRTRNQIVWRTLSLAQTGEITFLLDEAVFEAAAPYEKPALEQFTRQWHDAIPQQRSFYSAHISYLLQEYLQAKLGFSKGASAESLHRNRHGFAALWLESPLQKTERFAYVGGLIGLAQQGSVCHFNLPASTLPHAFRQGDLVLLYPEVQGQSPLAGQLSRGTIISITSLSIGVEFKGLAPTGLLTQAWAMEPDFYESNAWGQIAFLSKSLQQPVKKPRLPSLLLQNAEPESKPASITKFYNQHLNPNQQQVISAALAAQDYFLLIGPPGTGKTSTALVELVLQELAAGRRNITILAYTTRAVEEIAQRLAANHDTQSLRVVSLSRKGKEVNEEDDFSLETVAETYAGAQIYLSTIAGIFSRIDHLDKLSSGLDLLIIDEASQVTECMVTGLLGYYNKFVLIGDERQLPPVSTLSMQACQLPKDCDLAEAGFTATHISLFERLMGVCTRFSYHHAYGVLTSHFRMHNQIADLINPYYGNKLQSSNPCQQLELPFRELPAHPLPIQLNRVCFIETGFANRQKQNLAEAQAVAATAHYYINNHKLSLGIISPWRAQIHIIQGALSDLGIAETEVKVDTVERFQGSERDIILLSCCLSHAHQLTLIQSLWHDPLNLKLQVDRKLLVAISRAREQLIVFGHEAVLSKSPHYQNVINAARNAGSFGMASHIQSPLARAHELSV